MPLKRQAVLDLIVSETDRPMRIKELAAVLRVTPEDYTQFRKIIRSLLDSGDLVRLKRNRIGPSSQLDVVVGQLSVSRGGTGFLMREGVAEDILIPETALSTAFDGDKVMVRLGGKRSGRQTGEVLRVVERQARNVVGRFKVGRNFACVHPDNPRFHRDIYIPPGKTMSAKNGEKVVAVLTAWEDPYLNPEGKITERIGFPGEPGVDMLTVIRSFGFSEQFPPEVLSDAEQASARFSKKDRRGRLDLTGECIYTIDPADAKDHDDAVSVMRTKDGYTLGVHIADVSHFVPEGSQLDSEAFRRGNSVYLPGMVLPMLPEILSNDVCSLKEGRTRLAHSFIIKFDKKGAMLDWQRADTIIESKAKFSYEDVQDFFDNGRSSAVSHTVGENLKIARRLAELLTRKRLVDGSLDFDLPEAKITLNERGEVLELGSRVRLESHRLVEEFMLAANRAAALEVFRAGEPFLYRVHDRPDLEKLEAFSSLVKGFGYHFPVSAEMKPKQFARFLEKVQDKPETEFINELLLRSMQKAVYQQKNIGHFGLAFLHYTHFTSPIRRYPDLLVHRLLRKLRGGKFPAAFAKRIKGVIDHVGSHCSETERIAERAERQAVKIKQVAYMEKHVGDEFAGVISGVMPYGFFVRLDGMGVEGLVRVSTIDDDYYHYDEDNYRVVGRRRGQVYRLGDAIRVGVLQVNKELNEIDLYVKKAASSVAKSQKKTKESARSGRSKVSKPKHNNSRTKKKGQPAKKRAGSKSGVRKRKRK